HTQHRWRALRWRCNAYGLEDIAGVYYRFSRSALAAAQRVSCDREPHLAPENHRARTFERWRAHDPGRDWPEAGEESLRGSGQYREARYHLGLASQAQRAEV